MELSFGDVLSWMSWVCFNFEFLIWAELNFRFYWTKLRLTIDRHNYLTLSMLTHRIFNLFAFLCLFRLPRKYRNLLADTDMLITKNFSWSIIATSRVLSHWSKSNLFRQATTTFFCSFQVNSKSSKYKLNEKKKFTVIKIGFLVRVLFW